MGNTNDMDYIEETESGLTLGDICKVILKRVWWVLGAAAVCLIVVTLLMQFWYNKKEQYYSISYDIVYPDSSSGKYPNGSDFLVEESISLSTLTDIKDGKYSALEPDEFKNINVSDMYINDNISISESLVKGEDGKVKRNCVLTVKAKYFGSDSQARAFMRTVAEYTVNRVNTIMAGKEYGVYLSTYESAPTYDEKISALINQKKYIEDEYTKLKDYGELADVGIASLHNIFTTAQQDDLKAHITAEKYVLDAKGYKINADTLKNALDKQIADNVKIIEAEESKRGDSNPSDINTNPYDQIIAELTRKNAEMTNEKKTIDDTLAEIEKYTQEGTDEYKAKQAFDARLDGYYSQLAEAAKTLKTVSITIYNDNSRVVYSSNRLEKQGGIHWILAAVLGAVVGVIVSAVVICIIDLPKNKRGKLAAGSKAEIEDGGEKEEPDAE